jgi:putative ABC transport system permease protein
MSIPLRPIVSAIRHSPAGALLVAIQIALALALLANVTFIVKQRVDKIDRPTGMDVANIFVIWSQGFAQTFDHEAAMREDLAYLRGLDGVRAVTPMSHVPLSGMVFDDDLSSRPGDRTNRRLADYYEVDHQAIEALGLRLIAGRGFDRNEVLPPLGKATADTFVPSVILTKAYADALFPDGNALGKTVYSRLDAPATVVGVVDRMHGGWIDWKYLEHVYLMPRLPTSAFGSKAYYVVRTEPGQRDDVARRAEKHLSESNPGRVIEEVRPLQYFKDRGYRRDRNMGIFLVAVTSVLLMVTSLGIFGLATFNVSTRTKQIGTRRALGARRRDIVYHFMAENWLITTLGVLIGIPLALAGGYWLSHELQLPPLNAYFLTGTIVALFVVGQLASWQPARRAASVPPAVATRTV